MAELGLRAAAAASGARLRAPAPHRAAGYPNQGAAQLAAELEKDTLFEIRDRNHVLKTGVFAKF